MRLIKKVFFGLKKDLGLQILFLYGALLLPIVVGGLVFDYYSGERLQQDVMGADLALAKAIAQETDTLLSNALIAVQNLSAYESVQAESLQDMDILFEQVSSVRPDVNLIYRLNNEGMMVYHYPGGINSTIGQDFSFREYYQNALLVETPFISLGRISPTTEEPVATAVMPIWNGDQFGGLVATNIKLQSFSNTLASIALEYEAAEKFEVMILDQIGNVIAHPVSSVLLENINDKTPQLSEIVQSNENGNFILGEPSVLYSVVQIPSVNWTVIVSRPTAVAFSAPNFFHQSLIIAIVSFAIIGVFFWAYLSNRILQPVENLAEYSVAIGSMPENKDLLRKRLDATALRGDQLGHLTRSIDRMESDIERRFEELSTLLDISAAVVSTLDFNDVLNRILDEVQKLLDVKMCAIVALDEPRNVFKAVVSQGLSKRYAEQLIISPDEPNSATLRAIKLGYPIQIEDTENDASFTALRPRARAEGYRSFVAIPLKTTHAPPAALVIYSPIPQKFSTQDMDLLTNFANHAAMALENAELFARSDARLQEQTRRLEALIGSMESGLLLEDLTGKIIYANRQACGWANLKADDVIGKQVEHYYDALLQNAENPATIKNNVNEFLSQVEMESGLDIALEMPTGPLFLRLRDFLVRDSADQVIGRGQILRDATRSFELDRMKSSLISTASHELRTPLAAIKGYASTLLAEDVDWDSNSQKEFLTVILDEADRLNRLVNNLLDLSRIESGKVKLSRYSVTAEELVRAAISQAYPNESNEIIFVPPVGIPNLMVDVQRIEMVLRNLIENAVKYSDEDSPITIEIKMIDQEIMFTVRDLGPGVPLQEQAQVFSSFYRMEQHSKGITTGVGLGLAIARGFILAHGGRIWFDQVDIGTSVSFSIPLSPDSEPDRETKEYEKAKTR